MTLLTDKADQFATAKTYVFFDSVLWEASFMEITIFFFLRIGSDRRETDGNRVEKLTRVHYRGNPRRNSKR